MLTELHIQNFAIIDKLDLRFDSGLIILTGETGAGKSIILDAVVMLIGKADDFCENDSTPHLLGRCSAQGPEKKRCTSSSPRRAMDDPNYVVLMREVRKEGRSVARINGRTVNVGLLKELGALLVDIHGQAEHLSLLDPRAHLGLLDRYAEVGPSRLPPDPPLIVKSAPRLTCEGAIRCDRRIEMLTYQAGKSDPQG
jgi:DNA repair protein RecN (Recombination protein N)